MFFYYEEEVRDSNKIKGLSNIYSCIGKLGFCWFVRYSFGKYETFVTDF